jgi:regulator of sigma E protease
VRFLVYAAGPAVNVIFAFALLFGLFVSHSAPFIAPIVNTLTPDGAALAAGLQPGDRLTAVNGVAVYQFSDVHALATLSPAHHPDTIAFIRDGQVHSVVVVKKGGLFGIQSPDMRYASGPLEAAEFAATAIASATNLTVNLPTLLWQLKEPPGDVLQGPVAIADMTGDIVKQSGAFAPLAMLTALLSIAIGLTNLIPIPILDGGRMLIIVIEALARRQLDRRIENLLVASSAAFMLVVLLLVTYKDVSVYFQ